MKKKSVLLVDDEEHSRFLIHEYLKEHSGFYVAGECCNGLEAIKSIDLLEPDVVFLDIQMPGVSGFEVLQRVHYLPQIIFTTAFDTYAIKAFELNAIDYLLKPYTRKRFDNALERTENAKTIADLSRLPASVNLPVEPYPSRILVEWGKKMRSVSTRDILYLKADKDYTEIHMDNQYYLSSIGIGNIIHKLDPHMFIRVHRSYIVNVNHIKELFRDVHKTFVVMSNNKELSIGRHFHSALKRFVF